MRTLGVDLSSQPKRTAVCLVAWRRRHATVELLELGVDDERTYELADRVDKVGLDVPFGWPSVFVEAVARHHRSQPWPAADSRELRFRRTDLFVWARTGRPPLSVSTDRIGVPTFRAARLLSHWHADRTGSGRFVEVYPRAGRYGFGLGSTRSMSEIRQRAPWLKMDEADIRRCEESEDCFDALVASLVTRASAQGLCETTIPLAKAEVQLLREQRLVRPRGTRLLSDEGRNRLFEVRLPVDLAAGTPGVGLRARRTR